MTAAEPYARGALGQIDGKARTVRELLTGAKYSIDYYQREYQWYDKQMRELVDDLTGKFQEEFQRGDPRTKVQEYPHYFLGSIIISENPPRKFIVDGQQRLTSLTLLLIFLRNLQKDCPTKVNVDEMIQSEKFGQRSFNLDIDERAPAMEALYEGRPFDVVDYSESVRNLVLRYADLETQFPEDLRTDALPYFIDWLLENVHLIEITAYSDDDAYTIFETMNDRGLSLSPVDMLKGYLLAKIDERHRTSASNRWRDQIRALNDEGKEIPADFFKAWFRSQYASKIRERKKGAHPEDFDRMGTEFHRWLRSTADKVGLSQSDDYWHFIKRDFMFYSSQFLRVVRATARLERGLERIFYIGQYGFTHQHMLLLAPLRPADDEAVISRKLALVAHYIDILLTRRIWNFRTIAHSTMQYAMFLKVRDIRGLEPDVLAEYLYKDLHGTPETFRGNDGLHMHQQNGYLLHRILARLTDYVETQSGEQSHFSDYVAEGKSRYEIEHIWANQPEQHADEFSHESDFRLYRNRVGGLLLLRKSFNASYGDLPYQEKLRHYNTQNLLARSLHPDCYERNPDFKRFVERSGLPFKPYHEFKRADLDERGELYRSIAERIWNPDDLLAIPG